MEDVQLTGDNKTYVRIQDAVVKKQIITQNR